MKSKGIIVAVVLVAAIFMTVLFLLKLSHNTAEISEVPQKAGDIVKTEGELEEEGVIANMELTSNVFENNGAIPSIYTCDGENMNPPLEVSNVPAGAKSLALVVDDPDALSGDWVHWLVWNIDPNTKEIAEGRVPDSSVQGTNDFGKNNYGGPCPPSGTHRYQFKLYALDEKLNLESGSRKKELEEVMGGHILEESILVGLYKRG